MGQFEDDFTSVFGLLVVPQDDDPNDRQLKTKAVQMGPCLRDGVNGEHVREVPRCRPRVAQRAKRAPSNIRVPQLATSHLLRLLIRFHHLHEQLCNL